MASTTAMLTGLTGLNSNARTLDIIGNNIANANTTAYKSNRMLFASQFARSLSLGSGPSDASGGSNPAQIGLGVTIAGTQRNFTSGSLAPTGDSRDLAIDGDGFFVVSRGTQTFYTRAGGFRQDAANNLTNISGDRLQGYAVDSNFNIISGTVTNLNIPVGQMRLAQATSQVNFTGNLNASGAVATRGSRITFPALNDTTPAVATGATLLTALDNPLIAGNQALYAVGDIIEINGAVKGGKELPTAQYTVTATSTVNDYLAFLNQALGLQPSTGANPDGFTPGATIDGAGVITLVGNTGSSNDFTLQQNAIRHLSSAGTLIDTPFTPTKAATADGESVRTTFISYDSLGSEVRVDISMVLESRTGGNGTSWRYFIESGDAAGTDLRVGTGTLAFDDHGRAVSSAPVSISIDRTGSGASTPLTFDLNFAAADSLVSALAQSTPGSSLNAKYQDGVPIGVLSSYSVGADGMITGSFSNGQTRTVGQVALAKFSNPEGLVDVGSSLFTVGPNSGTPIVAPPKQLGNGSIVGGALEQSNVDLAQEFINMIQASTGYSAASRVITTTDQLMQQLLAIGR